LSSKIVQGDVKDLPIEDMKDCRRELLKPAQWRKANSAPLE
jgi:hypothetical protein